MQYVPEQQYRPSQEQIQELADYLFFELSFPQDLVDELFQCEKVQIKYSKGSMLVWHDKTREPLATGWHDGKKWTYYYNRLMSERFKWEKLTKEQEQVKTAALHILSPQTVPLICNPSAYQDQVMEYFYPSEDTNLGYFLPWEKTHNQIKFLAGDLTIWTGFNGHGKTLILLQCALDFVLKGAKIFIASLELKQRLLISRMIQQLTHQKTPSRERIIEGLEWLDNNIYIFDVLGNTNPKQLFENMKRSSQEFGTDVFIIDSLMKLGIAEDDYQGQVKLLNELCEFKHSNSCHIHLVAHPRKPPRNENDKVTKMDVKGTGAITDEADNCIEIWRNKPKENKLKIPTLTHEEKTKLREEPDTILTVQEKYSYYAAFLL